MAGDRALLADLAAAADGGRLTTDGALELLDSVRQQHTQWSVVYDLADRSLTLFTDRQRDCVHKITPFRA